MDVNPLKIMPLYSPLAARFLAAIPPYPIAQQLMATLVQVQQSGE
jgi:hypothetical protein